MSGSKVALLVIPTALAMAIAGAGIGVGYHDEISAFLHGRPMTGAQSTQSTQTAEVTWYTCSMHPQVIRDGPGTCPICHMPLSPVHSHGGGGAASATQIAAATTAAGAIAIDPVMVQNMALRTAHVQEGELRQTLRAVGTLTEPEQNHLDINLRVSGWIQKLYANQDGMLVSKGDPLFDVYSPEITAAADELITARKAEEALANDSDPVLKKSSEAVVAAGKRKLSLLGLSDEQVNAIAAMDKAPATVTFSAPIHGHVAEKSIIEGSNVMPGQELMKIADRSTMWLQLQIYEQQLGLVTVGEKVKAMVPAVPGTVYDGTVDFLYPHLDTATRTAMVRVVLNNADHRLHENMYATAEIEVPNSAPAILVPREAVIDSGLRQIVFVDQGNGHFVPRQVTVGRSGRREGADPEMVQILSGLQPSDVVVTSGQFLLDSESRMQEAVEKMLAQKEKPAEPNQLPVADRLKQELNPKVDEMIHAYLPLAAFFGAPQTSPTPADVRPVAAAADKLAAESDPSLQEFGRDISMAAKSMTDRSIDEQRTLFKKLSGQVVALARQRPLSPAFGKLYAFKCTMDNSEWLQQTPTPANPFFPVEMKTCGELTTAITPATEPAAAKQPGKEGGIEK
jgi:RND family efflux transporter MFP subunit